MKKVVIVTAIVVVMAVAIVVVREREIAIELEEVLVKVSRTMELAGFAIIAAATAVPWKWVNIIVI